MSSSLTRGAKYEGKMSKTKIILVEDDKTMAMLLKTLLDFEGFETTTFSEGNEEALFLLLHTTKPRILIMDVYLTNLNGVDFLKRLKSTGGFEKLLTLMTSGMDMRKECLDAGADGFMMKPYLPDELIKWLHERSNPGND